MSRPDLRLVVPPAEPALGDDEGPLAPVPVDPQAAAGAGTAPTRLAHARALRQTDPALMGRLSLPPRASGDSRTAPSEAQAQAPESAPDRKPLGKILLEQGAIAPADLVRALALQVRQEARLGEILLHQGLVSEDQLRDGLAAHFGARVIGPDDGRPDPRLIDRLGAETCLRQGILPWRRLGGAVLVATARPADFALVRAAVEPALGPVAMAVIAPARLEAELLALRGPALDSAAQLRIAADLSCRSWRGSRMRGIALGLGAVAALGLAVAPKVLLGVLLTWCFVSVLASTALKAGAFAAWALARRGGAGDEAAAAPPAGAPPPVARLPVVSVLVPLYREGDIAARLVGRLGAISYPRELLDVLLVVEAADTVTRAALRAAALPRWIRVITVPDAPLRTKPRALNFAVTFARGSIVGVWDAEDAPAPDQIHQIVRRFRERGPDLACVQGVLDYYNPRTNWLSRCFTIEYAAWFRILLPGMERLGLAVPLGGTTLFFRREALDRLGGWDAHNVTEDADLGIRLARMGYRTELLQTVTLEEANCRVLPWIRQRSRWLKGYAMTWAVHMRDPARLWRDLGPWRFLGVQVLFLGTLSQFVLAPVLWSFWITVLGLGHPLDAVLPRSLFAALTALFVLSEAVNLSVLFCAVSGRRHRFLRIWVPTMHAYFPLAAIAAYKGLWELAARPFYWDKTAHGIFDSVAGGAQVHRMGVAARP